eukprot:3202416-Rhodomonas_salina.4
METHCTVWPSIVVSLESCGDFPRLCRQPSDRRCGVRWAGCDRPSQRRTDDADRGAPAVVGAGGRQDRGGR